MMMITIPGTIEILLLTVGALRPTRTPSPLPSLPLKKLAVIIPAHNEEAGIARTVTSLSTCDRPQTECAIWVIADNCTDNTAVNAQTAGAHVLVRTDNERRGKGHALNFAFTYLLERGVDAFLIVDADTVAAPNFLTACEQVFVHGGHALQCRYTVNNPDASLRTRLLHVALLAFNVLRPRGREHWGLSVGISGNGFGLTRQALQTVPYQARSVVEDLEYHLALVRAGIRVHFVDTTTVRADMPTAASGSASQRARWEGGRLRMIRDYAPRLAVEIVSGQWRLLEPLLDLLLLPLAFHVMLLLATIMIPVAAVQGYAMVALSIVAFHIIAALWVGNGTWKDVTALAVAPFYILWKLTLLPKLWKTARIDAAWVRTDREPPK